ncbi:low molecular weight phosphotyrosine protein phosphatase [Leucobacter insecticola]|uniref:protein-tyrosine-phosphatase n=1 Tax=Leucobacter insecticola TaxID=2714934 RepID=A0A6G8FLQ4_9MICO|nr:low molecular weight phosphotyrosine protein phosphatase [Leucobacter insecticola]
MSFVCTGNICRSPMGEVVFRRMVEEAAIGEHFVITSRGMGDWHVGNQADPRTITALARRGYDGEPHRAAQLSDADIAGHELLIALDRGHEALMRERGADPERVVLLTNFDPERPEDPDVFDPYWSDDDAFDRVLAQVERSCAALLHDLRAKLGV